MAEGTTQDGPPLSEADKAHRIGRWVGVPLLAFICLCVLLGVYLFIGTALFLFLPALFRL